jgi:hypothetical protein
MNRAPEVVTRRERRFGRALEEHRAALDAYVSSASALRETDWLRGRAGGKWSAAETTEHLSLTYEATLQQLRGEGGMRPRTGRWMQLALRIVLLPHILFHRTFPIRAAAPREIRPVRTELDQKVALKRLVVLGREFEAAVQEIRKDEKRRFTHPYFGGIPTLTALRLTAIHTEHHRRQITPPG